MYEQYVLAFLSGVLVKIVDNIEDKINYTRHKILKWPLAIAYGAIIGYLVPQASFSMLFFGALLAQVVAYKIDRESHLIGFIVSIAVVFSFGLPPLDYLPFVVFLIAAYLDELTLFGIWKKFADYRFFLILAATLFVVFGRFDYLIGIVIFDLGYVLIENLKK